MAENVLADAALRRTSGTSPSALGVLEFHWIARELNWILCEDIDWIHSRFSEIRGKRGTSQEGSAAQRPQEISRAGGGD